jgi:hypothetical protein
MRTNLTWAAAAVVLLASLWGLPQAVAVPTFLMTEQP